MTPRLAPLLLLLLASNTLHAPQGLARELETLKSVTEKWIQLRNQISKEQASWTTEKELLQGSVNTLESTKTILEEDVKLLELKTGELQSEIAEAKQTIEVYERSNAFLLNQVANYESRLRNRAPLLPDPLNETLGPLLRKIPDTEGAAPPLPNRLQNVVAIATLIDEFNNDLTLTHTIKELDDGSAIEVRVLYWGLAGAYACNADGSKAWILQPSTADWTWIEAKENPADIKRLFDVYDKTIDPTLANVPFAFQEIGGEK